MILPDWFLFALLLIITGAILFLFVYFILTISDLECDYLNAQQCCSKLNFWVWPKMSTHMFVCFILLMNGHWWLFTVNLPMAYWMIDEIMKIPRGNIGVYEPTEIYNHGQLSKHMRKCLINLGFYLTTFFAYLYCIISSLLDENPLEPIDDNVEF